MKKILAGIAAAACVMASSIAHAGPELIGNKFWNSGTGAGTIYNIVAAASNTGGLIIRTLNIELGSGNAGGALYASTNAPSTCGDNSTRVIFDLSSFSAGNVAWLPYPLLVPAGQGLWVCTSVAGGVNMTYDLLSN